MASIQQSAPAPIPSNAKPYDVFSMVDVQVKAVRYADGSSRPNILLALIFGTDVQTGKPNVVIQNPDKIQDNYVVPTPKILAGILRLLDAEAAPNPSLPEGVPSSVTLEEVQAP